MLLDIFLGYLGISKMFFKSMSPPNVNVFCKDHTCKISDQSGQLKRSYIIFTDEENTFYCRIIVLDPLLDLFTGYMVTKTLLCTYEVKTSNLMMLQKRKLKQFDMNDKLCINLSLVIIHSLLTKW